MGYIPYKIYIHSQSPIIDCVPSTTFRRVNQIPINAIENCKIAHQITNINN